MTKVYIVEMINPQGGKEYLPPGFGFSAHSHVLKVQDSNKHETRDKALNAITRYWFPGGFWESERRHAEKMKEKFKGWKFQIIEVQNAQN